MSPKHTQILNANVSKTHRSFKCNLCQEHTESLNYVKTHWDLKLTYVTTHRLYKYKYLQNTLSFKLELAQMFRRH